MNHSGNGSTHKPGPHRPIVFVTYDHRSDQEYYEQFTSAFSQRYQIRGAPLTTQARSMDPMQYIARLLQEGLRGAYVTVVLCGPATPGCRCVDWDISASLQRKLGLIGINLPTNSKNAEGKSPVPMRLYDNLKSGYASLLAWNKVIENPVFFDSAVLRARNRDNDLIDNHREQRQYDAPVPR